MAVYRYAAPSLLDEITFVHTEKGGVRAYLEARQGAAPQELGAVVKALHEQQWNTVPFSLHGRPMLEVRGFGKEKTLLERLAKAKALQGEPVIEHPKEEKLSLLEIAKQRSLQVAGGFYLAGDMSFITYGWKEGSKLDVAGGIMYGLGTLSLLLFGNNDQGDLQVEQHAKALEHFLIKENVRIPSSCSLHTLSEEKGRGLIGDAYDWMRSHPAEMLNTIYIGAGACIAAAALKHKVLAPPKPGETAKEIMQMRAEGWLDVALGTTTSTVSLLGNIITEKKQDPDEPLPQGMIQKAIAWVEEKPLRLTGYGMMASTLCHAFSTAIAYQKAKRQGDLQRLASVPYRALFVGGNLVAELMIALSSKGHGEGVTSDASVNASVYATAAELIVQQPVEQREYLIQHVSAFLQQPNVLAEAYETVDKELRHQVALLEKNPWVCQADPLLAVSAARVPATPGISVHPGAILPHAGAPEYSLPA